MSRAGRRRKDSSRERDVDEEGAAAEEEELQQRRPRRQQQRKGQRRALQDGQGALARTQAPDSQAAAAAAAAAVAARERRAGTKSNNGKKANSSKERNGSENGDKYGDKYGESGNRHTVDDADSTGISCGKPSSARRRWRRRTEGEGEALAAEGEEAARGLQNGRHDCERGGAGGDGDDEGVDRSIDMPDQSRRRGTRRKEVANNTASAQDQHRQQHLGHNVDHQQTQMQTQQIHQQMQQMQQMQVPNGGLVERRQSQQRRRRRGHQPDLGLRGGEDGAPAPKTLHEVGYMAKDGIHMHEFNEHRSNGGALRQDSSLDMYNANRNSSSTQAPMMMMSGHANISSNTTQPPARPIQGHPGSFIGNAYPGNTSAGYRNHLGGHPGNTTTLDSARREPVSWNFSSAVHETNVRNGAPPPAMAMPAPHSSSSINNGSSYPGYYYYHPMHYPPSNTMSTVSPTSSPRADLEPFIWSMNTPEKIDDHHAASLAAAVPRDEMGYFDPVHLDNHDIDMTSTQGHLARTQPQNLHVPHQNYLQQSQQQQQQQRQQQRQQHHAEESGAVLSKMPREKRKTSNDSVGSGASNSRASSGSGENLSNAGHNNNSGSDNSGSSRGSKKGRSRGRSKRKGSNTSNPKHDNNDNNKFGDARDQIQGRKNSKTRSKGKHAAENSTAKQPGPQLRQRRGNTPPAISSAPNMHYYANSPMMATIDHDDAMIIQDAAPDASTAHTATSSRTSSSEAHSVVSGTNVSTDEAISHMHTSASFTTDPNNNLHHHQQYHHHHVQHDQIPGLSPPPLPNSEFVPPLVAQQHQHHQQPPSHVPEHMVIPAERPTRKRTRRTPKRWDLQAVSALMVFVRNNLSNSNRHTRNWAGCAERWNRRRPDLTLSNDDLKMKIKQLVRERPNRSQHKNWDRISKAASETEVLEFLSNIAPIPNNLPLVHMARYMFYRRFNNTQLPPPLPAPMMPPGLANADSSSQYASGGAIDFHVAPSQATVGTQRNSKGSRGRREPRGYLALLAWAQPYRNIVVQWLRLNHLEQGRSVYELQTALNQIFTPYDVSLVLRGGCPCSSCRKWGLQWNPLTPSAEADGQLQLNHTREHLNILHEVLSSYDADKHQHRLERWHATAVGRVDAISQWSLDEFSDFVEPLLVSMDNFATFSSQLRNYYSQTATTTSHMSVAQILSSVEQNTACKQNKDDPFLAKSQRSAGKQQELQQHNSHHIQQQYTPYHVGSGNIDDDFPDDNNVSRSFLFDTQDTPMLIPDAGSSSSSSKTSSSAPTPPSVPPSV